MSTMFRVSLTIGHNVGTVPMWDHDLVCCSVHTYLGVNGFTSMPCVGMWKSQAEQSTRVEIVVDTMAEAEAIIAKVPKLARFLKQEAIMTSCEPIQCDFITPNVSEQLTA